MNLMPLRSDSFTRCLGCTSSLPRRAAACLYISFDYLSLTTKHFQGQIWGRIKDPVSHSDVAKQ
jgi:hypothetical protein